MRFVRQPIGSKLCGHACLAMVWGWSLSYAAERLGHRHGTRTIELTALLGELTKDYRLIPVKQRDIPEYAILKVTWEGKPKRSHYMVYKKGWVYDPLLPHRVRLDVWKYIHREVGRITSSLKIEKGVN